MTCSASIRLGLVLAAVACTAMPTLGQTTDDALNLYDWMGVAPTVVHGEVRGENGKYIEVRVDRVIRGDLEVGQPILVNLRKVNRGQDLGDPLLKLPPGKSFLLLLQTAPPPRNNNKAPSLELFDLVRGVNGAREVPPEGSGALLDAAEALARVQDRKDERFTWTTMRGFLEDTNPVLIGTALEHHLKFDRGGAEVLSLIRPLLDHPRADLREGAAQLIGEILSRAGGEELEERSLLLGELAARARRDPVVPVRIAATVALGSLWNEATRELLEEIARDDPDQQVRYAAERLIYVHEQREGARAEAPR